KGLYIELAREDGRRISAGGPVGSGGGGELALATELVGLDEVSASPFAPVPIDWGVFPERVVLTLSYVAHVGQWQGGARGLSGEGLHQTIVRAASRPAAGRYLIRLAGAGKAYLAASIVELYRFELRAAPGSLRAVAEAGPPPRCAADLDPAGASDPLHRAFAL